MSKWKHPWSDILLCVQSTYLLCLHPTQILFKSFHVYFFPVSLSWLILLWLPIEFWEIRTEPPTFVGHQRQSPICPDINVGTFSSWIICHCFSLSCFHSALFPALIWLSMKARIVIIWVKLSSSTVIRSHYVTAFPVQGSRALVFEFPSSGCGSLCLYMLRGRVSRSLRWCSCYLADQRRECIRRMS